MQPEPRGAVTKAASVRGGVGEEAADRLLSFSDEEYRKQQLAVGRKLGGVAESVGRGS